MKNIFLLFSALILMNSCKTAAPVQTVVPKTEENLPYYFVAAGNEPFWDLKIGKEETVFKSLIPGAEKIVFKSAEPYKAMDANNKLYKLKDATGTFAIGISKRDCEDTMTGIVSPYSVVVGFLRKSDNKDIPMEGCGRYLTDYRLHDIWVLEELNGKKVSIADFQKELPRIEINTTENKFMGFGGCNSISGSLFFEKDLLRFTDVISTMMACGPNNKENEFVKALQSTTSYNIGNNRLSLSNPSGTLLVLRKVY